MRFVPRSTSFRTSLADLSHQFPAQRNAEQIRRRRRDCPKQRERSSHLARRSHQTPSNPHHARRILGRFFFVARCALPHPSKDAIFRRSHQRRATSFSERFPHIERLQEDSQLDTNVSTKLPRIQERSRYSSFECRIRRGGISQHRQRRR